MALTVTFLFPLQMAPFTSYATVAFALLAAQGALALPEPDAFSVARSLVIDSPVIRRQFTPPSVNSTSADCSSQCSVATTIQSCSTTDIACLCSQKIIDGMDSCFDCILATNSSGSLTQSQLQSASDQYVQACNSAGQKVSGHTITASKDGVSGASTLKISAAALLAGLAMAACAL